MAQGRKKKRSREFDTEFVSSKKFKAEQVHAEIKEDVFRYNDDQWQFEELFKAIKASQITQSLEAPTCIITEIATYATGSIKKCANTDCNELLVHLCEDAGIEGRDEFDYDAFDGEQHPSHDSYVFDPVSENFYCRTCAANLEWCFWTVETLAYYDRDVGHYVFLPECTECSFCKKAIHDCNLFEYFDEEEMACDEWKHFECEFCEGIVCTEIGCSFECQTCERRFCGNCASDGYDSNLVECEECRC